MARGTAQLLAKAHSRPRLDVTAKKLGADVYDPSRHHPPQAIRDKKLAMDDNASLAGAAAWANAQLMGNFAEGTAFLGYAYLAELAQRPEYRMICETPATEMTREWIELTTKDGTSEDKTDKINELKDELDRLKVRDVFCRAIQQDGYFGRGHIYIDTGDTDDAVELRSSIGNGWDNTSANKLKQKKIIALRTVEAVWCYPTSYNSNNPLKEDWYKPSQWFAQGTQVHKTRLLTLVAREVPDLLKPTYSFGGLSLSQLAKPYVDNWLQTRQSVNDIINAFSVMVLLTNMQESVQGDGQALFDRAELFNLFRSNAGIMMLDKDTEQFQNVSAPISGLEGLQAQAQEHMCAVAHTPSVKLLGIQPEGMNADSEGIMRSYYDYIHACQEHQIRPHLHQLIGVIETCLWGKPDPDIVFNFKRLFQMTEKERSELRKSDADRDTGYIESGVLDPAEVRKRLASDPESGYNDIDPDVLPEKPEEEVPPGGGPGEGEEEAPTEEKPEEPEAKAAA
jgi:phage-related protein (TIGR01555 family)